MKQHRAQRLMVLVCGQTEAAMAADDLASVMKRGLRSTVVGENVDQLRDMTATYNLYYPIFKASEDKRYNDAVGKVRRFMHF